MVSETEALKSILTKFPDFESYWKKESQDLWGEDNQNITSAISSFSHYIRDMLIQNDEANEYLIARSFQMAEWLMNEGTKEVKDAVATCFLENLINAVGWGKFPASRFVHLLGKESKKYCRAWDEFTGVKTKGL